MSPCSFLFTYHSHSLIRRNNVMLEMTMLAMFAIVFGKAYSKPLEELKKVNGSNKTRLARAASAIVDGLFDRDDLSAVDPSSVQSDTSKATPSELTKCSTMVRNELSNAFSGSTMGKIHAFRAATIATIEAIFVGTDKAKEGLSAAYNVLNANGYKQVAQRILAVFASSVETDEKGEITVTMSGISADQLTGLYAETPEYYAQRISVLLCHDIDYKVNDKNEVSCIEDVYARDKSDGTLLRFMWKRSTLKSAKSNTAKKASKATSIADMTEENINDYIKAIQTLAKSSDNVKNAFIALGVKFMNGIMD